MALRFKQQLASLQDAYPHVIEEVRGSGLLTGLKLKPPLGEVVDACMAEKLLTVGAGDNVVRLLPPLNVTEDALSEAVTRLGRALARLPQAAR
jgi:acetylornithine/N-succinyldiaminopimelate aminotransferase